jgi:Phosphotransferase enzyme family
VSEQEVRLPGGNVGGAVRVGDTVRRHTGPWTPAVHALLRYLSGRVPGIPEVLGHDDQGREILSYLPGTVIDVDAERLNPAQISSVVRWTRCFHQAASGFAHPGPWRFFPVAEPTLIAHNDIAPYNVCFDGDEIAGVFDWDLAGPSSALLELAFIAWNCVPLWEDIGAERAASRLELIASAYAEPPDRPGASAAHDATAADVADFDAVTILRAVPGRIQTMLDGIPVAAAAGDQGMVNLMAAGEPQRSQLSLDGLVARIPAIEQALPR